MAVLFANNATGKLAGPVDTTQTNISLRSGEGARFPSPSGGDWFPLTLLQVDGTLEIMRCTGRTNDVLTVVRGQESTTPKTFSPDDRVALRLTMATLDQLKADAIEQDAGTAANYDDDRYAHRDNNLSDLADAAAARTSLGLGSAAVQPDSRYAHRANALSDVHAPSARSNLGLGTAATYNAGENGNLDADKLDGRHGNDYLKRGETQDTSGQKFYSGAPPAIYDIAASGNQDNVALTIGNGGNNGASCVIQFHRAGSHASYLGLDTDNRYKVGGRSMGDRSYAIWHDGEVQNLNSIGSTRLKIENSGSYVTDGLYSGGSLGFGGGTWRCTGFYVNIAGTSADVSLFRRIS